LAHLLLVSEPEIGTNWQRLNQWFSKYGHPPAAAESPGSLLENFTKSEALVVPTINVISPSNESRARQSWRATSVGDTPAVMACFGF
jgi:hypothetical protein